MSKLRWTNILGILPLLLISAFGQNQAQIYELRRRNGPESLAEFGHAVAVIGDLDNDGSREVLVGAPYSDAAASDGGEARVYNGRTGLLMSTISFNVPNSHFGWAVSTAGDMTLDGVEDFCVTTLPSGGSGQVRLYSGATFGFVASYSGLGNTGTSVTALGDINGDNRPEIAVGRPTFAPGGVTEAGRVDIVGFSSTTLFLVTSYFGTQSFEHFGAAIAAAGGDLDGDGAQELIVGAPDFDGLIGFASNSGRFTVISPGTGTSLFGASSTTTNQRLGIALSGGADFTGDGSVDIAVGSDGSAFVYSGATGTLFTSFTTGLGGLDDFGRAVALIPDITGDGIGDLGVGAPLDNQGGVDSGALYVYRGATTAPAATFVASTGYNAAGDHYGESLAVGDTNGDGAAEFLVSAPMLDSTAATGLPDIGNVAIVSLTPAPTASDLFSSEISRVASLGDVDGDGVGDYGIGYPFTLFITQYCGAFHVYSGATRTQIRAHSGCAPAGQYGLSAAGIGDLTGDGKGEYIIGDPGIAGFSDDEGRVEVRNGATGSVIPSHSRSGGTGDRLGFAVAALGDVDQDGVPDYAVASPADDHLIGVGLILIPVTDGGRVDVYSGATATLIRTFLGQSSGDRLGTSIAGVDDMNGDGIRDIAIGIPFADDGGTDAGRVEVRSIVNGSLIYGIDGNAGSRFGTDVDDAHDVNADGIGDFVVGAPYETNFLGPVDGGALYVHSGATGAQIVSSVGVAPSDHFGTSVAGLGDIDGDGRADVAGGGPDVDYAGNVDRGTVRIVRGTGGTLLNYYGEAISDRFGIDVAGPGDLNGDGRGDVVVAMDRVGPGNVASEGLVILVPGVYGLETYGAGTPGCFGRMRLYGTLPPVVGNSNFSLTSNNAPISGTGFLIISPSTARVDAGFAPMNLGFTLHVDALNQPYYLLQTIVSDISGHAIVGAPIPNVPALAGLAAEAQMVWYFGGCLGTTYGLASTNGLEIEVQP